MENNPFKNKISQSKNPDTSNKEKLVSIEIAQESDVEVYKNIRIDALTKNPEAFSQTLEQASKKTIDQWRADILSNNKFVVLGKIDSSPMGAISLASATKDSKKENLFYITEVYTKEDFRQKGTSEQVLEKVLKEISNRKGLKVKLGVRTGPKQEEALKLYKKLGFKIIGTSFKEKMHKLKIRQDYGSYIMEKDLTPH